MSGFAVVLIPKPEAVELVCDALAETRRYAYTWVKDIRFPFVELRWKICLQLWT